MECLEQPLNLLSAFEPAALAAVRLQPIGRRPGGRDHLQGNALSRHCDAEPALSCLKTTSSAWITFLSRFSLQYTIT
jgi:hypothetical protein